MASPYALDFNPLSQAIQNNQQLGIQRNRLAQDQQRLDWEGQLQPFKVQAQQQEIAKGEDEALRRKAGMYASDISDRFLDPKSPNYIQDSVQRAQEWNQMSKGPLSGMSYFKDNELGPLFSDPERGPGLVYSIAKGYEKPVEKAHANYYNEAAKALGIRASAATDNAATRRMRAITDMVDRLGPNPSREQWEAHNGPGGLIPAVFGQAIPFERAPIILAQARQDINSQFEPTEEDKIAGITREHKINAFRQNRINQMYGVEDKDLLRKGVRLKPEGSFEDIPGGRDTQTERQARTIAQSGLNNLQLAEDYFKSNGGVTGTVNQAVGNVTGQGESGRAFKAAKMGIVDLVFALSGKSVSNKEREEFLSLYLPSPYDTQTTQLWKIQRAKAYFETVLRARGQNASDDEIADITRFAIRDGMKGPGDNPKQQDRLSTPSGNYRYNPSTGKIEPLR